MKIIWSAQAEADLNEIFDYILKDSPLNAIAVYDRLRLAAESLSDYPKRYRRGQHKNTHEFAVPGLPYILVYEVTDIDVRIRAIFHGAQDKPRGPA